MKIQCLESRRCAASFTPLETAAAAVSVGRWDADQFDDLAIVDRRGSRLRIYTGSEEGLSPDRFRELPIPPPQLGLQGTVTEVRIEPSPIRGSIHVSMLVRLDPPAEFTDLVSLFWMSDPPPRVSELTDARLFFSDPETDVSMLVFNDGSDFNGDGIADLFSVEEASVRLIVAGDANRDGEVNLTDFLTLSSNFGRTDASFADGDFNGDSQVSLADFLLLREQFGAGSP